LRAHNRHLGENVVGLRGLVDQVYRQIHHKVNREDIKKLISAKYVLLSYCSLIGYSLWTRHTGVGILLPWLSAHLFHLLLYVSLMPTATHFVCSPICCLLTDRYSSVRRRFDTLRADELMFSPLRLAQMEQDILRREEEMFHAASSTRCMSCGQLPADPTNAFVGHSAARRVGSAQQHGTRNPRHPDHSASVDTLPTNGVSAAPSSASVHSHANRTGAGLLRQSHRPNSSPTVAEGQEYAPFHPAEPSSSTLLFNPQEQLQGISAAGSQHTMDDDISLHSEHSASHPSQSLQPLSHQSSALLGPVRSEEIYNVITGSAGLKSLMPQHTPMLPVRDPYGITNSGAQSRNGSAPATKAPKRVEKVPEPMYRKAKMAAHLKELVKVSAPSAQNYGFTTNNPFFVMDGYAMDEGEATPQMGVDAGGSLYSTRSGANTARRPKTQGSQGGAQQTQQVYVPIPRSSIQPHSVTQHMLMSASLNSGVGEGGSGHSVSTVLPHISSKQAVN
jgi:hypothetical protein